MQRQIYHPNACLAKVKNVNRGLRARTQMLNLLEKHPGGVADIARETSMHYNVVVHHLKLLQKEEIVDRKGKRPYTWSITGLGQTRLTSRS